LSYKIRYKCFFYFCLFRFILYCKFKFIGPIHCIGINKDLAVELKGIEKAANVVYTSFDIQEIKDMHKFFNYYEKRIFVPELRDHLWTIKDFQSHVDVFINHIREPIGRENGKNYALFLKEMQDTIQIKGKLLQHIYVEVHERREYRKVKIYNLTRK